ncbi:hypothetical protein [Bosea sp. PAMC 26642]|uniref:hypothetical protein n=1 Tax=Bosea sp. (strain PAMC 26642) TaxID=1792307 RepID=UPI000A6AF055|nr:hypothetical protein [Bosea sp. PAMC 26642]
MPAFAPCLADLRRSILGAWLGAVYALAVLAAGLLPAPALAMPPGLDGMVLCSGATAPGDDRPAPAGDTQHCKGCPVNPVVAIPPVPVAPALHRFASALSLAPIAPAPPSIGVTFGLPRPRGPPLA